MLDLVGRGECHLPRTCILAEIALHGAQNLEKLGAKTISMAKSICRQYKKSVFDDLICTPTGNKDPEIGHNGQHYFSTPTPYLPSLCVNPFLSLEALNAQLQEQKQAELEGKGMDLLTCSGPESTAGTHKVSLAVWRK